MKLIVGLFAAIQFLLAGSAVAVVKDTEIIFTAKDVQAVLDKTPRAKPLIDGLFVVSLEDSPVIRLGDSPDRVGVSARLSVQIAGAKPMPARISGSASIIYVESRKSFFLVAPIVESINAPFIPAALEAAIRAVISNRLEQAFGATPVYTLTERRSKEWTAWQSLSSIQIRKGAVVAKLAPR
ncbi:MAG: DUF1439 domain-containing protein [Rhodoferax sp.]